MNTKHLILHAFALLIIIVSCSPKEQNQELEEMDDGVTTSSESSSNQEESISEQTPLPTHTQVVNQDSIDTEIAKGYFSSYLEAIFPDRALKLEKADARLNYESSETVDLSEYIEGGGVSLNYLKVIENGSTFVGFICYELYNEHVYANGFGILPKGNNIASIYVAPGGEYPAVHVFSNKSGLLDEGPFELNIYSFLGFRGNGFPLLTVQTDDFRALTTEENAQVSEAFKQEFPRGTYLGGGCPPELKGATLPGGLQLEFGDSGRLNISVMQFFSAECFYYFPEPNKITIINRSYKELGGEEDEPLIDKNIPRTTIRFNTGNTSDEIKTITFLEGIPGLLQTGTACKDN